MDAAVVELDALTDAVRTAAEHHDLPAVGGFGLALLLVGGVEVGGVGRKFGGAGVDALVDGTDAHRQAGGADLGLLRARQLGKASVGEALALEEEHVGLRERGERIAAELVLGLDDLADLIEEPRIDGGEFVELFVRHAGADAVGKEEDAFGAGHGDFVAKLLDAGARFVEAVVAGLQTAQGLLQGFLEGAADGHHLAHGLHLRREAVVGGRELLEARHLRDDVVDRRLEGGGREAAGDFVAQLVERVAHGELGGDAGDREARGLGGECGGAGDARIHLDDDHAARLGIDGELDVGAARVDADLAQNGDRGVAHALVLAVGERLGGRNRDGVARMHAHRVEVLDGADDDAVVRSVADDFHFVLLPAEERLLDEELVRGRELKAAFADLDEALHVVGDAAAGAAERERRTDHGREAELRLKLLGLAKGIGDA